jgi:hypothetical protein
VNIIYNIYIHGKQIISFSLFFSITIHYAIAQDSYKIISQSLTYAQFENIRVTQNEGKLIITAEDNLYRWNVRGIAALLDIISKNTGNQPVTLILLKKDIPQIEIETLNRSTPLDKNGELRQKYIVHYATDANWKKVKSISPTNSHVNKIDLVIYPQFGLQNTLLSQIYEVQLNIAPAIELSLWRGMQFTGQVIFPIVNQMDYEDDFIRPGFITLSQEFRLPHQWFGQLTVGNFNSNRYGLDATIDHPFPNPRWAVSFNAGLTGSSSFYEGEWISGELNILTWFIKARYFYPKFNLQFDLSYGRYLNKDYGFRADCTRHFGETTVGFYAMYTGGEPNGGFHFAVPLPTAKRNRRHALRLAPPRYFDWEYNAGTEFYYGRYYETRPNENRSERWHNPLFIKNELLKTNEK